MIYATIAGIPPYDGRWELDWDGRPLNTHEWGWVKRIAGYLPQDFDKGIPGDPELVTLLAAFALTRAGKTEMKDMRRTFDYLASAPFGEAITVEGVEEEVEDDAGPPPESSSRNIDVSGPTSKPSSVTSEPTRKASGTHASATSVSAPPRSAIEPRRS